MVKTNAIECFDGLNVFGEKRPEWKQSHKICFGRGCVGCWDNKMNVGIDSFG